MNFPEHVYSVPEMRNIDHPEPKSGVFFKNKKKEKRVQ